MTDKNEDREQRMPHEEGVSSRREIAEMLKKTSRYADRFGHAAGYPRSADGAMNRRLPEDYPLPREILRRHFPRTANQCCFKGGWGYDAEHATIVLESDPEINPDEKFDGVSLEYAFIDKRIREELIFARPEGERFCGLDSRVVGQSVTFVKGVPHDRILVEVTAYPENAWNELKADWESHDGYKNDPEGREKNLARKEAVKLTYRTEYWFDIADFFYR